MNALRMLGALLPFAAFACAGETASLGSPEPSDAENAVLSGPIPYRGVNLAGAEFGVDPNGNGSVPGTFGTTYTYPDPAYVSGYNSAAYYIGKGMTTFRLPFRWERLQPSRRQPFNAAELTRLTTTVNNLLAKGAAVVLDPHNYARYGTQVIGSSAVPNGDFADFWGRLASQFKGNSRILFGLMNEPHDMSTEQWAGAAQAAVNAIRAAGANNLILIPGNGWDGAHSWLQNWYGTANGTALLNIKDPGNNYAYEVHQYIDNDSSGAGSSCPSNTIGSQRLSGFTSWLKAHGKRGFLGEFSAPSTQTCYAALDDMLKHIEANQDVWLGWTYWAGGPWWGNGTSLEPSNGADKPQMGVLVPHLNWGSSGGTGGTCTSATYPASTMFHSTGGATSGGWNLWTNGYVATNHTFVAATTKITVYAAGTSAANVAPHMVVSVGGVKIGEANVPAASYTPYTFSYPATAGTKEIRVAFDNDYHDPTKGQDRNLLIQQVVVSCN